MLITLTGSDDKNVKGALEYMGLFSRKSKSDKEHVPVSEPIEKQFERLIVRNPGIVLNKDELCVFAANAYIGKKKTRTVGYKTSGVHANAKVLGLNFRAGNTQVDRQKEEYWEKTPCRLGVCKGVYRNLPTDYDTTEHPGAL